VTRPINDSTIPNQQNDNTNIHPYPLHVIVSVDAEDHFQDRSAEDRIRAPFYHDFSGIPWGLDRISTICQQRGIPLTVFMSVFEHVRCGFGPLADMGGNLTDHQHEIQLHTHPDWAFDPNRKLMCEYSLDEQINIMTNAVEVFEEIYGEQPTAHRAGAYGVNRNTLLALIATRIPVDMSAYHGHRNCQLAAMTNHVDLVEGILEVPVTGVIRERRCHFGRISWPTSTTFIKTDIEFINQPELEAWVEQRPQSQSCVLVLFMHSYSLLKSKNRVVLGPDTKNELALIEQLDWLAQRSDVKFETARSLYDTWKRKPAAFSGVDFQPKSPVASGESIYPFISRRLQSRYARICR
jgi:hypothetical protein